jgi:hypothetical protein
MKIEVISNALSIDECRKILSDVDPINTATPMIYFGTPSDNGIKKVKVDLSLVESILKKLTHPYDKLESVTLVYYPTGSKNTQHCDNSQVDIINNEKHIKRMKPWEYTGIIFLNDNFTGGELIYPEQGCVFLPKIGTMILTPAGPDFPHFVSEIKTGERFTLVFRFL